MTHLFICREYPPAAYLPGGIGTYLSHVASLLAAAGETVHVISHRWSGAPHTLEESVGGRLIVHRVALDGPVEDGSTSAESWSNRVPRGMLASSFPSQAFSWQAAMLAERLIEQEGIDVVEGQEWEAPLYYLQLRRALNLGPGRQPPCVVHLHSPTELIFAANGWDTTVADYRPAVTMEAYSIEAADALLCPSRYLADQVLSRYRVERSRLTVIPYPRGDFPKLERRPETWSSGSICYVGRLEPRKGVLEWAEAVAMVADDHPTIAVDFVGGDMPLDAIGGPTVRDAIRARVPRRVLKRFRFHGSRGRAQIRRVLASACAGVVPSRWENLPYSCLEAMSSGLPIIASPTGGMREIASDGVSGWIAADATPKGLAGALRRMIETPPARREQMGRAAAEAVRRLCDNDTVIARHLQIKGELVRRHASRIAVGSPSSASRPGLQRPMGVVVNHLRGGSSLAACLSSISQQTDRPAAVCVVGEGARENVTALGSGADWQYVRRGNRSAHDAAAAAAESLARNTPSLAGLAFVDSRVRLDPAFLSICHNVFAGDDRLGIIAGWTHVTGPADRVQVPPCPAAPYLWQDGDVAPVVAVRLDAFEAALKRPNDSGVPGGPLVFDRVAALGWAALVYPGVLCTMELGSEAGAAQLSPPTRFSSIARAVQRLHTPLWRWFADGAPAERRALLREVLRDPARSARWLAARWTGRRSGSTVANRPSHPQQLEVPSPGPSRRQTELAFRPRGLPPRPPD